MIPIRTPPLIPCHRPGVNLGSGILKLFELPKLVVWGKIAVDIIASLLV